jgi:hypothetical protein
MFSGSGAATADLSGGINVNVMHVLLSLEGLPCGLAEHGPQFGCRLLPLGAAESFRPNDELAFRRNGDNQLGHDRP